jgi:hypothetical protein
MNFILAVVALLVSVFFAWFFHYLKSLEEHGCECALDNRRVVLMVCVAVIIVSRLVAIFTKFPQYVELLLGVVSLTFLIVTIWYVSYLRKVKCQCSESLARTAMEYYAWTMLLLIPIALLLIAPLLSIYIAQIVSKKISNSSNSSRMSRRRVKK